MIKKLLCCVLTALLALPLSACAWAEEPTRIVFWHSMSEEAGVLMEKYVREFNDTVGLEKALRWKWYIRASIPNR